MRLNFLTLSLLFIFQFSQIHACNFSISTVLTNPTCGSNGSIEVITVPATAAKIEIFIGNSLIYQSTGIPSLKTPAGLGVGIYKVRVKDLSDNCVDSLTNVVLTNGANSITVTPDITKPSCKNSSDGIINLKDSKSGTTFKWSHSAAVTDSVATNLLPGNYYVTITNGPCSIVDSFKLGFVDTIVAKEVITPENCGKKDGTINFTITGGNQPYSFNWSNGSTVIPLVGAAAGTYTVTITDSKNCPPTIGTYSVKSNSGPQGTIDSVYVCAGESTGSLKIKFINKDTAKYSYRWNHNSLLNTYKVDGLTPGLYSVTITDTGGCESIIEGKVLEYRLRLIKIKGSDRFYAGSQNHYLEAVPDKNDSFVNFIWSPDSFVTKVPPRKALIFPKKDTFFLVKAIDENGCITKDSFKVIVVNDLFTLKVPNIFTPNNDGLNDVYTLYDLNKIDTNFASLNTYEIHIFDRWGNEVYSSNDITMGWDGSFGNDGLNGETNRQFRNNMNGVYSYIITYTLKQTPNQKNILSGNITMVK